MGWAAMRSCLKIDWNWFICPRKEGSTRTQLIPSSCPYQDWWTVTDCRGRVRERYLFLFKARILVTKVRRVTDDRNLFLLKDIIRVRTFTNWGRINLSAQLAHFLSFVNEFSYRTSKSKLEKTRIPSVSTWFTAIHASLDILLTYAALLVVPFTTTGSQRSVNTLQTQVSRSQIRLRHARIRRLTCFYLYIFLKSCFARARRRRFTGGRTRWNR